MFNKIKKWLFHEDLKKQNLAAFIMLVFGLCTLPAMLLASFVFGDENACIRFDMSEYKQKGDITKLIGDRQTRTKGQLTEKVKQKPYSVILIDEVEKAHSEVVDLFTNEVKMDGTEAGKDLLGRTYEYCIAQFAAYEGTKGGA